MKLSPLILLVALVILAPFAGAAIFEPREFDSPEQEASYKELTNELRCLVCQNQNIADSEAELAGDLRREVYTMLRDGKNRDQVVEFMVNRYGDFVLYRPPLRASTIALWSGPFILGLGGLAFLIYQIRRRTRSTAPADLSEEERRRLAELMDSPADGKDT